MAKRKQITEATKEFKRIKAVPCTVDRIECESNCVTNKLREVGLEVDKESYALFAYMKDYSELTWEEKQDCKRAAYLANIQ